MHNLHFLNTKSKDNSAKWIKIEAIQLRMIVAARLHWRETLGMPIFFGKKYFEELCNLPDKKGGSYVVNQHLEKVKLVSVQDEKELWDLDTREDLALFGEV